MHIKKTLHKKLEIVKKQAWWLGLLLVAIIAGIGLNVAALPAVQHYGLSAMTFAIVIGMVLGNTLYPTFAPHCATGVDFAAAQLLRVGVALYGFRLTFQQLADIGWQGLLIDILIVSLTFSIAVFVGTRLFKMDRQTAMLIGAGSSICGAAAVMATEPVVKGSSEKVSIAVATVVVFGTISMFLYPMFYSVLGMPDHNFGIYIGSTVHEVAQVVAAGKSIGETVAATAVIEKMLRVLLLAPFLLVISYLQQRAKEHAVEQSGSHKKYHFTVPTFALVFIGVVLINSFSFLPQVVVQKLIMLDNWLLAMAMAALGVRTHVSAVRRAGVRPILLAFVLFVFLTVGGYCINRAFM